jgi:hypothetical protein
MIVEVSYHRLFSDERFSEDEVLTVSAETMMVKSNTT